jgi:hypothetical protein
VSDAALDRALDELVPESWDAFADWDDALRRAGIGGDVRESAASRRWLRRRLVPAVAIAVLLVALIVTPAFGIGGFLLDLIGRTNVPFSGGKSAPVDVKRNFFDLTLFSPPGMGPEAIASQARRVGVFRVRGRERILYVAPTRRGGYCWIFAEAFGGCHATRPIAGPRRSQSGAVNPWRLGVTWQGPPIRLTPRGTRVASQQHTTQVGGDLRAASAHTLQVEYEDDSTGDIPFIYVSKPIDAGFFLYAIPSGHKRPGTRVRAVRVLDSEGNVLARQPIRYLTRRDFGRPPRPRDVRPPAVKSPRLPAPTAPLQQGENGGVRITAGRNRVVVFDTSGATDRVEALLRGRATFGCFSFMQYHRTAPAGGGFWRTVRPRVAIRVFGLRRPFDGCEIRAGHGHLWPDRNGSHSAVEVAFSARGRRYFADRAAARDLALFVRSDEMHRIRKLTGDALRAALRRSYGGAIRELRSPTAALPSNRVGYVVRDDGVTFVERSATGRLFNVVIRGGRIVSQNVKPLGFVY